MRASTSKAASTTNGFGSSGSIGSMSEVVPIVSVLSSTTGISTGFPCSISMGIFSSSWSSSTTSSVIVASIFTVDASSVHFCSSSSIGLDGAASFPTSSATDWISEQSDSTIVSMLGERSKD